MRLDDVNWQAFPSDGIVCVHVDERTAANGQRAGDLAIDLRDALEAAGRHDLVVAIVPPGLSIEALDTDQMAVHGWIRRQDKQPLSPPTSLGTEQVPLPKEQPGRG